MIFESYQSKNCPFDPENIKLIELFGNWRKGWALCYHTISSKKIGPNQFETKRPYIAEMLYKVKYNQDFSKIDPLAKCIASVIKSRLKVYPYLNAIIPVPPSDINRKFQPVLEIAKRIGLYTNIPVRTDYLVKVRKTPELKTIEDKNLRLKILDNVFEIKGEDLKGRKVLLFDDIFRSGATLEACTKALIYSGKVDRVYVLTITKTRKKF